MLSNHYANAFLMATLVVHGIFCSMDLVKVMAIRLYRCRRAGTNVRRWFLVLGVAILVMRANATQVQYRAFH